MNSTKLCFEMEGYPENVSDGHLNAVSKEAEGKPVAPAFSYGCIQAQGAHNCPSWNSSIPADTSVGSWMAWSSPPPPELEEWCPAQAACFPSRLASGMFSFITIINTLTVALQKCWLLSIMWGCGNEWDFLFLSEQKQKRPSKHPWQCCWLPGARSMLWQVSALQYEPLETLDVDTFYYEINANLSEESLHSWQRGQAAGWQVAQLDYISQRKHQPNTF